MARMRALGFLVEIGYPELCWSAQEAAELVTRRVGAPVDAEDLQHIVSDTQGWVAGIAIASDLYRQVKERNAHSLVRPTDRKSVVAGKSMSARVTFGGRRHSKKKTH